MPSVVVDSVSQLVKLKIFQGPIAAKGNPDHFPPKAMEKLLNSCKSLEALFLEAPPKAFVKLFQMRPQKLRVLYMHSWTLRDHMTMDKLVHSQPDSPRM